MSKNPRPHLAWLVLAFIAAHGCSQPCPPDTVQSGKVCLFKHDAAAASGGRAGAGAIESLSAWSCAPVNPACVCSHEGTPGTTCPAPLPPCCFTVADGGGLRCECWPDDSLACTNAQTGQHVGAVIVASCPPP
jgi:hypothetical protein